MAEDNDYDRIEHRRRLPEEQSGAYGHRPENYFDETWGYTYPWFINDPYGRGPGYPPDEPYFGEPIGEKDEGDFSRLNRYGYEEHSYQKQPDEGQGSMLRGSWQRRGPYTGRGPRGYQRSAERIREDVSERMTQHGHLDPREIAVEVENGEVTLNGMVDSRQAKRLAEDIAHSVPGVRDVHNRLTVKKGFNYRRAGQ